MRPTHPSRAAPVFRGLAEFTFQTQLGVADPPLLDYVSDLLTRFVRTESLQPLRSLAGRPLRGVGEMLLEAQQRVGSRGGKCTGTSVTIRCSGPASIPRRCVGCRRTPARSIGQLLCGGQESLLDRQHH